MHQHLVAGRVAVLVVDELEVVDVQQRQRQRLALGGQRGQQFGAAALEVAPVPEARERVALGRGRVLGGALALPGGVGVGQVGLRPRLLGFGARDEEL